MPRSASIMSSGLSWVKLRRSSARSHWGISSKSNPTMPASIAFIPTKSTASMLIFYCATPRQYVPSWGSSWMIRVTNAMTARSAISLWSRSLLLPGFHCCVFRSSTPTRCRKFRQCCSPTSSWMPANRRRRMTNHNHPGRHHAARNAVRR